jgi:hypothetical protein
LAASNDNVSSNDFTSALILEAVANQVYFVAVDGMRGQWGAFNLGLRGPEVSDVPGPIPTSLAGKHLVLEYNGQRELFEFLSETTGIYEQGDATFTYAYNPASSRIRTQRDPIGGFMPDFDIGLQFTPGSSNKGTATADFFDPEIGQIIAPFTLF